MKFPYQDGSGGIAFLALIGFLFGLFTTLFWMLVGWRAMLAHEQLAGATAQMAERSGTGTP